MTDNSIFSGRNRILWALVLIAGVLYFSGLGSFYLTDRDEGEYASAVMSMQKNGDFTIPRLNGEFYLEKPILVFWLIAGSEYLFGNNEFAVRFHAAVSAFVLVLLLALFLKKITGTDFAILALSSIIFMPMFALIGKVCETDMVLALCTTVSLLCFFIATESEKPVDKLWYYSSWIFVGIGFLTKGPVATAVIIPTAFFYSLARKRFWQIFRRCGIIEGIIIFTLINLPWYWLVYNKYGNIFIESFFGDQILKRGTKVLLGHGGGPFYYIPLIIGGGFPYSIPGVCGLFIVIRNFIRRNREPQNDSLLNRLVMLSAISVLIVLAVFSLAATKLPHYILPSLPFLGILSAYFWIKLFAGELIPKWIRCCFWILLITLSCSLIIAGIGVPVFLKFVWPVINGMINPDSSEYALPMNPPVYVFYPLLISLVSLLLVILPLKRWRKKDYRGMAVSLISCGAILCVSGLIFGTAVVNMLQHPFVSLTSQIRNVPKNTAGIVTFGLWKPTLFFYADREKITRYKSDKEGDVAKFMSKLAGEKPVFVVTRQRLENQLSSIKNYVNLATFEGYMLGGNAAAAEIYSKEIGDSPATGGTGNFKKRL